MEPPLHIVFDVLLGLGDRMTLFALKVHFFMNKLLNGVLVGEAVTEDFGVGEAQGHFQLKLVPVERRWTA